MNYGEEGYAIFITLGVQTHIAYAADNLGHLHVILGEYDLARNFYERSFELSAAIDSRHGKTWIAAYMIHLYCDLEDVLGAREWVVWGSEEAGKIFSETDYPPINLAITRYLILKNHLDEAQEKLKVAYASLLKRGADFMLAEYYYVQGLYESALENHEAAISTFRNSLDIYQQLNQQGGINRVLLAMTKVEIAIVRNKKKFTDTMSFSVFMDQLEQHARENNYQGILMQHALLKAEYQTALGEHDAAQLTLKDALTFTDSLGVKTLRKRILERIQQLEKE